MYKHHKLYDISNFIKQVVDIGIKWWITTQEYEDKVWELFKKMPQEFIDKYKDDYEKYILAHAVAEANIQSHEREIPIKERIWRFLQAIITRKYVISDKRALLRFNDMMNVKNDDISVTQHWISAVVTLPQDYWNRKYWENRLWFVIAEEQKKDFSGYGKIYIWENKDMKKMIVDHEYTHTLHHLWLLKENQDIVEFSKWTHKSSSVMNSLLKDEFLARMASNSIENAMKEYSSWKDIIIPLLVINYLWKYIKEWWFDENIIIDNEVNIETSKETWKKRYKFSAYQKINWEKKPLPEKTMKLFLEKVDVLANMYVTYEKLNKICFPKYYPSIDQFHYMLAFTPLSQRQKVLDTYQKIDSFEESKSDVYSVLSSRNN